MDSKYCGKQLRSMAWPSAAALGQGRGTWEQVMEDGVGVTGRKRQIECSSSCMSLWTSNNADSQLWVLIEWILWDFCKLLIPKFHPFSTFWLNWSGLSILSLCSFCLLHLIAWALHFLCNLSFSTVLSQLLMAMGKAVTSHYGIRNKSKNRVVNKKGRRVIEQIIRKECGVKTHFCHGGEIWKHVCL